jgi:2-polyprenyl-6-methoxyphenol hydroxylase-like FAD-dependent oxidoreductase
MARTDVLIVGAGPTGLVLALWLARLGIRARVSERNVPLRAFPWGERPEEVGLARGAGYLVRPDGYVALAGSGADVARRLRAYLQTRGMRLGRDGAV